MLNTAIDTLKDQEHKTRIGTAIFWTILSIIFIAGGGINCKHTSKYRKPKNA